MWDERYGEPGFAYGTEPNDFLVSAAERIVAGPVLCLAEGEGRNAVYLASRGHAVTAVDGSAIGLAKARALATERGVELETVVADLADYRMAPNAYSAVVCIWCHLPATVRERVHRAAVGALRKGGLLILEAYTPRQLAFATGGPKTTELLYTLDELRQDFAGLELVVARETEREVHEGRFHSGKSAVVQIIGEKA